MKYKKKSILLFVLIFVPNCLGYPPYHIINFFSVFNCHIYFFTYYMILELKYPLKCGKSDENVKAHFLADDIYMFLSIMLYKNFTKEKKST